jgi:6-pyruvoyltetrahydropterin/6-carboxytetrahydropterin synthase
MRLSRTVRFSILPGESPSSKKPPHANGHAGYPDAGVLAARYFELTLTLDGEVDATSGYLRNIKLIDDAARQRAVPLLAAALARSGAGHGVVAELFAALTDAWPGATLAGVELHGSPYTSLFSEGTLITLRRRYEFSAAHRLHNATLSDAQNRELFGKCNNPLGHGHNYEFEVSVRGATDDRGTLIDFDELDRIVFEKVVSDYDHKHLNLEVVDFAETNPSAEHIARAIFGRLKPALPSRLALVSVKVWETPKTAAEYAEA